MSGHDTSIPMVTVSALNEVVAVRHGFFTREGGVSEGLLASLNCGLGTQDVRENVLENRRRAMANLDLPLEALATVVQKHTATCEVLTAPWPEDERPVADAMVTDRPGIALGILTADCVPVLFAEPKARVIGAAHAGWRGAVGGVLEATVTAMESLGAQRDLIAAATGPCIGPRSYQVGHDVRDAVVAHREEDATFFIADDDRWLFDLPGYVLRRLAVAGLHHVGRVPCDTYREPQRFYSYRRGTHHGEPDYGRQLSAITLAS